MTHIGFTGTQVGMTLEQEREVDHFFSRYAPDLVLHHGDCIGADETAHSLSLKYAAKIVIHPPTNSTKRAWCESMPRGYSQGLEVLPTKPYLDRNRDIVDASEFLLATPKGFKEELRSGTWSTIRYARRHNKKVYIIYPDGSLG